MELALGKIEFLNFDQPLELTEENLRDELQYNIKTHFATYTPVLVYLPSPLSLVESVSLTQKLGLKFKGFEAMDKAIPALYNSIQSAWHSPFSKYLVPPQFAYSLETCAQLFIESCLNEVKPRLLPNIKMPSRDACAKIMKEFAATLPWSFQDLGSKHSLSQEGANFTLARYGERGELEKQIEISDSTEAYWQLINAILQLELNLETFNKTFDAGKFELF